MTTDVFDTWLSGVRDRQAKDRIRARIQRAAQGNFGDWKTESGEIRAMRIDYGPGYRLYYTMRGALVVILLAGGDKRTESRDIAAAVEIAKEV